MTSRRSRPSSRRAVVPTSSGCGDHPAGSRWPTAAMSARWATPATSPSSTTATYPDGVGRARRRAASAPLPSALRRRPGAARPARCRREGRSPDAATRRRRRRARAARRGGRARRSRGRSRRPGRRASPTATRTGATCPPLPSTAMRSPSSRASSMSWVTNTTVLRSALQRAELHLQLGAHDRVDRAEGLVHQQHRRLGGERAGHADALLLAAGQLAGIAGGRSRGRGRPGPAAPRRGRGRGLSQPSSRGTVVMLSTPSGAGRGRPAG